MKYVTTFVACLTIVCGSFMALAWRRSVSNLDAQEPVKTSKPATATKESHESRALGKSESFPYPVFFVEDVVAHLSKAAEELIEKKRAKTSDELRKNLDRTVFKTTLPAAQSKPITSQELYRRAVDSVFLIAGMAKPDEGESAWKTSFSTAFAVHEDGILSTSAHVFDHDDHDDVVLVLDVHGKVYPLVEILAVNRQADTCLFRIDAKGLKPLPLGTDAPPGSDVRVIGHPGDSFFFFSAGHLANYERDEEDICWLNITADFGQGSSGGPVMDEAGNVIGQVSRTYTLFAGGAEARNSRRAGRTSRRMAEPEKKEEMAEEEEVATKRSDPQMVFKSCTPVSTIRSLVN